MIAEIFVPKAFAHCAYSLRSGECYLSDLFTNPLTRQNADLWCVHVRMILELGNY